MRDWQQFVRERLGRLGVSPQREAEITEELAGYLEDRAGDPAAANQPMETDWHELRGHLLAANLEGDMSRFKSSFWLSVILLLPAAAILWLASVNLAPDTGSGFIRMDDRPGRIVFNAFANEKRLQATYVVFAWLAALPVIGAVAAWCARRWGAPLRQRMLIGAFPAVVMLGILSIGIPGQLVGSPSVFGAFAGGLVVVLAAGLVLAAMPALRNGPPASGSEMSG